MPIENETTLKGIKNNFININLNKNYMKRFFTIAFAALSMMTSVSAQKINVTGPEFADDGDFINNYVWPIGLSDDGNVTWGYNPVGSLGYYKFNNPDNPVTWTEYTEADVFGIKVAGIPYDGRALVSNYLSSYFIDLETGDKEYIDSPEAGLGLDAWDVSADSKYVGCNLTDDAFLVIPMVGERQEDGTYKMTYLDYDKYDAMGCIAQYTQVRYVSQDGKYLAGIQPDNRGLSGRLVVWTRQDDGTYKFSTPLDDFLYDTSYEKPGYTPEWDDIVTADPEKEPEEFDKQQAEFDKLWTEFETKYDNYTRNRSGIELYTTEKETRSVKIAMSYNDYRTEDRYGIVTPVIYDCENSKFTIYEDLTDNAYALEQLPGGGDVIDDGYILWAYDNNGDSKEFSEWFKEVTDYDYTSIIHSGTPYFSENGKAFMLVGNNNENQALATLFRFDRDIFEATTTGIKVNVVSEVTVGNGKVSIGEGNQGVAEVYTLDGSKCGSYTVNGTFDFNGVLANGMYIVKVSANNEEPVSMKLIVKY